MRACGKTSVGSLARNPLWRRGVAEPLYDFLAGQLVHGREALFKVVPVRECRLADYQVRRLAADEWLIELVIYIVIFAGIILELHRKYIYIYILYPIHSFVLHPLV